MDADERRAALSVGRAIRLARQARGMLISEVADAAGVTPRTVLRLEMGLTANPSPGTVRRIARALGADSAGLAGVAPSMARDFGAWAAGHGMTPARAAVAVRSMRLAGLIGDDEERGRM